LSRKSFSAARPKEKHNYYAALNNRYHKDTEKKNSKLKILVCASVVFFSLDTIIIKYTANHSSKIQLKNICIFGLYF